MGWGQILTLKNDPICNFAPRVVTIYQLHWYGWGKILTLTNNPTCILAPSVFIKDKVLSGQHLWSIIIVCQWKWSCGAKTVKKFKVKIWHLTFEPKSTEVLLRSRSTYVCEVSSLYVKWKRSNCTETTFSQTDRHMERQTDSRGETRIPPQLRCQGYTNLFSMWRNRWKMTPPPFEVKISWGE